MPILQGPNGEQFAAPDWGLPSYDAGGYEPPSVGPETIPTESPDSYGLPPAVLARIAPGLLGDPSMPPPDMFNPFGSTPPVLGPPKYPPATPDAPLDQDSIRSLAPNILPGGAPKITPQPDYPVPPVGPVASGQPLGGPSAAQPVNVPASQPQQPAGRPPSPLERQVALVDDNTTLDVKEAEDILAIEKSAYEKDAKERARLEAEQAAIQARAEEKRKQYEEATDRWANSKIDRGRLWSNASTGQHILAAIGVAMSALGDIMLRRTGPNAAMAVITGAIERDVQDQMNKRDHLKGIAGARKNSLDDYEKMGASKYEMGQLKLSESYKRVAHDIRLAKLSYGGERAKLNGEMMVNDLVSRAAAADAAAAAAASAAAEKRLMEQEELKIKKADLARKQAETYAGIKIAKGRLALDIDKLAFDQKSAQEKELAALKAEDAKLLRDRGIGGAPVEVKDKDGKIIGIQYGFQKLADGKTNWIPTGSESAVDKAREALGAAATLTTIADEITRKGHEWFSDTANSKEVQKIQQKWAAAKLVAKEQLKLGALTESDLDLIEGYLGSPDPSKWKDTFPGIRAARETIAQIANQRARDHGLDRDFLPASEDTGAIPDAPKKDTIDEMNDIISSRSAGEKVWGKSRFGVSDFEERRQAELRKMASIAMGITARKDLADKAYESLQSHTTSHIADVRNLAKELSEKVFWERARRENERKAKGAPVTSPSQSR